MVKALCSLKADLNRALKDGRTPLFVAAEKGQTDVVEELGRARADVNQAGTDCTTPLRIAISKGHIAVEGALRRLGALDVRCDKILARHP